MKDGFTGNDCEITDMCSSNPCKNNATCNMFNETSIQCDCSIGFSGDFCQISKPLKNLNEKLNIFIYKKTFIKT